MNGNLTLASEGVGSGISVLLTGGAQPKNVFWVVTGNVVVGTNDTFNGIMLTASDVSLLTNATLNGRALTHTQVVLQKATVTQP